MILLYWPRPLALNLGSPAKTTQATNWIALFIHVTKLHSDWAFGWLHLACQTQSGTPLQAASFMEQTLQILASPCLCLYSLATRERKGSFPVIPEGSSTPWLSSSMHSREGESTVIYPGWIKARAWTWEWDTIISNTHQGLITFVLERKSMFLKNKIQPKKELKPSRKTGVG